MDEDTLIAPAAWRRLVHPRRGGPAGPPVVPAAPAAEAWRAVGDLLDATCNRRDPADPRRRRSYREQVGLMLRHPATDPALAAEAEAYLRGAQTAADPRGAAAVAVAVAAAYWAVYPSQAPRPDAFTLFCDHWVTAYGAAFAAGATAHLGGLYAGAGHSWRGAEDREHLRPLAPGDGEASGLPWHHIAHRLRAYLAGAPQEEYRAAGAALADLRRGPLPQRVVAAYLMPTRTDWVDEDCAERAATAGTGPYRSDPPHRADHMLLCSAGSAAQLDLITPHLDLAPILRTNRSMSFGPGVFPTIAEGVGAPAAPTFARWADHTACGADVRRRLLAILAELPGDEAGRLLVERLGRHPAAAAAALHRAARRFPERTARLLRAAAAGPEPVATAARALLA